MIERRGRPPSFTRAELISAARRLGPDAISLPAVAAELQVGRTSLYWHVRDRDEIGEAVLATIIEEQSSPDWTLDPVRSWDVTLAAYARTVRAGLIAAGGWIRYATPRLVLGRTQLEAMDGLVASLRACGFRAEEATRAYAFLFSVVLASIDTGDAAVAHMHGELAAQLATSDSDDLTNLRDVVAIAGATSPAAQFEYNLDCTLRGIADRSGIPLGTVAKDGRPSRRRR